jgi:hypothetical protein
MAHDVFISYSHKDKSVADAICSRLERGRIRCWYAPRDIPSGADWASSIVDAINSTKVMVLVFSDHSNSSDQVLREVSLAVKNKTAIVPFKITDSLPTKSMEYYLETVQWLAIDPAEYDNPAPGAVNTLEATVVQVSASETVVRVKTDIASFDVHGVAAIKDGVGGVIKVIYAGPGDGGAVYTVAALPPFRLTYGAYVSNEV